MPISATGNEAASTPANAGVQESLVRGWAPACAGALSRKRESGFTLVELLVVLVIIGVMSAAVLLAIPDPRGRLIDEAERFAARVHTARDLAIIESRDMSVRVTDQGYAFDRRQDGEWRPMDAKPFRSEAWTEGTTALVGSAGNERVSFDSTGLASAPLTVTLVRSGERATVNVAIDGRVSIDA